MKPPLAKFAHLRRVINGVSTANAWGTDRKQGDDELLAGLLHGAPAAVEALFDTYHGRVYGLAMAILKNPSDAEEVVQDVFLTVVRKAVLFRGDSALFIWIYRISVNACLTRLRGNRREKIVPIGNFMPAFNREGGHARPVEDWSREAERLLLNEDLGQSIGRFTQSLPLKYRTVFVLCSFQGLSPGETAQVLGLTIPTVKRRLHKARFYMRKRLGRHLGKGATGSNRQQRVPSIPPPGGASTALFLPQTGPSSVFQINEVKMP